MNKENTNFVKVAVVQATPVLYDKQKGIEIIRERTKEAASNGAQIVMWPESFIPGYPCNLDIENENNLENIKKEYRDYFLNSVSENDMEMNELGKIAADNKVYLLVGITEREGESLYCSECIWNPEGNFMSKHRKLRPTGFERLLWKRGEGSNVTTVDTEYGVIGTAICWENYMPLLRTALYAKNVKIYIAPAADSSSQWQSTLQHIALEGRCFVLCCNHYFPFTDSDKTVVSRKKYCGGSAILDPRGEYLAGPCFDKEEIIYADLDMSICEEERYDFDPVYPYTKEDYKKDI